MLNIPVSFDDLIKVIDQLSAEQKRVLLDHLTQNGEQSVKPRILGMHPGAIWTSDDFDDPLPDEFWLGKDA